MKEPKTPRAAGTLKAFVKVSKTGTDHTTPIKGTPTKGTPTKGTPTKGTPTKMTTRSRSATLSAQHAREQTTPTPASRKRKLTVSEAKPPELVVPETPTRKKQKNSSLHAYFPKTPTKKVELPEPVIRGAKKSEEEVEKKKPMEETRSERAHRLLERLRARKSTTTTTTQEDTSKIQEELRDRRHQTTEQASVSSAAAKFAASKTPTNEDLAQQDIARQFVFNPAGKPTSLPRSLRKLESLFQALEHSVMFGGLTADGVIYHRIRRSVESMAKHTFGWRELGQILALYPESYSIKPAHVTHLGMSEVLSVVLTPQSVGVQLAMEMEERRLKFRQKLVDLVRTAHASFLEDRGYTQAEIEKIEPGTWHPSFDLESVPAVEPLKLPLSPLDHQKSAKFDKSKLKHLLGKVGSSLSHKTARAAAPSTLPLPTPTDSPVLKPIAAPAAELPPSTDTKSASSNVSKAQSLLDRIREKQRIKEEAKAAAAKQKKDGLASSSTHARLPGILEFLSFLFYSERKSVLLFFYVVDKLVNSKHLDKAEAIGHLLDLTSLVPEWCTILDDDGKKQEDESPKKRMATKEPSAKALLKVIREISMQEAKNRLVSKISSLTE